MPTAQVAHPRAQRLLDEHFVSDRLAVTLRSVATVWAPVALLGVLLWLRREGIPAVGEAGFWETLVMAALLTVYAVGWLVSLRFPMTGGTVLAFAAVAVGILATLEERPTRAVMLTALLFVPAFLHWIVWQRTRRLPAIVALAVVLVTLLVAGGWAAASVWDHYYGPQHPTSPLTAGPPTPVWWVWSGAVTPTSASVVAGLRDADATARLAVATEPDLAGARLVEGTRPADDPGVVRFDLRELAPNTTYHYAVEVDGIRDLDKSGRFTTSLDGPLSFRFVFASCAQVASNGAVYDAMREQEPRLVLLTGDWFYADIPDNDPEAFRNAYQATLSSPAQSALYRSTATAYVWDDHDFGPNDANGGSASRPAAMQVYRARVPHYPLAADDSPVFQAFTIGRVRFVLTDTRSARDPQGKPDGPDKTMLGAEQRAWLERELVASSRTHALVVLTSAVPWITPAEPGADHWGGYATERRWLADVIAGHGITNLLMIAGDAHMVAIDDGSHSDFSTAGTGGFPLMQAAALDRPGSLKGGPYSEGAHAGAGQFGLAEIDDDGTGAPTVTLRGMRWDGEELLRYEFTPPAPR